MKNRRDAALSQDNLFHSMLGLLKVRTKVYDPALDMFAGCRGANEGATLAGK